MDAKALAKSKRAHSLHHSKKHHPKQATRTPTPVGPSAAKDAPKQTANQVTGSVQQSRRRNALPSNWDRYDEEDELDLGNSAHANPNETTDVPKSKGADYAYLISEAKSQLSSLDDDITDFYQGLCPLLSVSGEGVLSWIEDDNFNVDDESTANVEASFLSLDLNALSERLSEMDLCESLFIEKDDLLSMELSSQVSKQKQHEEEEEEAAEDSLIAKEENPATLICQVRSITTRLDDDLDNLLEETSSHGMLGKSSNIDLPLPLPLPQPQLDDTLDDLLNETSNLTNQSRWSPNSGSYGSVLASKLLDDDSFFDTL